MEIFLSSLVFANGQIVVTPFQIRKHLSSLA